MADARQYKWDSYLTGGLISLYCLDVLTEN